MRPKFSMRLEASQQKWPMLAQRFQAFGKRHNLQYFDTSVTNLQGLHMLNVHLCSPDGLWMYADKRLWDSGSRDPQPAEVPIFLFQYKETYDWKVVATEFAMFMRDWPGKVGIVVPGKDGGDSTQLLGANEQASWHAGPNLTIVRADAS